MKKYFAGVDFGTLSARAAIIDGDDGKETGSFVCEYPHKIMKEKDISGGESRPSSAYQHPDDYILALGKALRGALKESGVAPESVCGLGMDFTSSTVMPFKADGTPLCDIEEFSSEPHSYVKLWKHHGAEEMARRMTETAIKRGEKWLDIYGGKISSEWMFPKIAETAVRAPNVYAAADRFAEAGEWLAGMITGRFVSSVCMAGFKSFYAGEFPSDGFFSEAYPALGGIIGSKVSARPLSVGEAAGEINEFGAKLTGLKQGTPVAVPVIDAHAALPAAGAVNDGDLMMIIGTSACQIFLSEKEADIKGICGRVKDGVVKGLVAYEAGQTSVGDTFDWFVKNALPACYSEEAERRGISRFSYLEELASRLAPVNGLVALDWQNGNRTPYADYTLSGMVAGLTLSTKPEELYRAAMEGTAYGLKRIIEGYADGGLKTDRIIAAGGISKKSELLMKIYADVLGLPIEVTQGKLSGTKGSAIYAAAASKAYPSVAAASEKLADKTEKTYYPNEKNAYVYEKAYREYVELSEYFAKKNRVMTRLGDMRG